MVDGILHVTLTALFSLVQTKHPQHVRITLCVRLHVQFASEDKAQEKIFNFIPKFLYNRSNISQFFTTFLLEKFNNSGNAESPGLKISKMLIDSLALLCFRYLLY